MDKTNFCSHLPTEATNAADAVVDLYSSELGGHLTIFKRVSYTEPPELLPIMGPNEWREATAKKRRRWVAECVCSHCAETWYTAWSGPGTILLAKGEDGSVYPCLDEEDSYGCTIVEYTSTDGFLCPFCDEVTTLQSYSKMRSASTKRRLFQTIEIIDGHAVILAWLAERIVDRMAMEWEAIRPWRANVLMEDGMLAAYRFDDAIGWRPLTVYCNPEWTIYRSPDGMYGNMRAGWISSQIPNLEGTTAEKTGLACYMAAGGLHPSAYLRLWHKFPYIENIMRTPWATLATSLIDLPLSRSDLNYPTDIGLDLTKARPHEILGFRRECWKLMQKQAIVWSVSQYQLWIRYRDKGGKCSALDFHFYYERYKHAGILMIIEMWTTCFADLPKIDIYLTQKQGLRPSDIHLLRDAWRMTQQACLRNTLTNEELWPRHLCVTHDRLSAVLKHTDDSDLQKGFDRIREEASGLEYSDGELCVLLPRCNSDLIREGAVLRHCVGHYGESHVSGDIILFVRRHRRPERSYYTLNVSLTEKTPRRIQLHGYGNEHHGPDKEYTHSIPKKVLDFCDKWERDILLPWWKNRHNKEVSA